MLTLAHVAESVGDSAQRVAICASAVVAAQLAREREYASTLRHPHHLPHLERDASTQTITSAAALSVALVERARGIVHLHDVPPRAPPYPRKPRPFAPPSRSAPRIPSRCSRRLRRDPIAAINSDAARAAHPHAAGTTRCSVA